MRRLRLGWTILALLLAGAVLGHAASAAPCPQHGEPAAAAATPAARDGRAKLEPGLGPSAPAPELAAARDAARARSVPCCAAGSCALHCTPALPAGWTLATPEPGARHGPHPRHAPPSGEPRDPPWRPPPLSLRASA